MNLAIVGAIVSLFSTLLPIVSQVAQLWKTSAGFGAIAKVILTSPAAADLAAVGAAMFPAADKAIQAVLAAIHLGVPDATKWVQGGLNAAQNLGFIKFGPGLVVDGHFGPKTFAAVVVLQAKLKLPATGAVADAEYAALNLLLTGKIP
jgi:peptidoglycan hydrolase-like protein with peptidoglycan-binding domain